MVRVPEVPGEWRRSWDHRRTVGLAVASVLTTLFVVRMLAADWVDGYPVFFPDSSSYLHVATLGPFRWEFWFGERPILTPLLYWALGRNVRLAVLAQAAVYVAAFWWTVFVMWRVVRSVPARVVAAVTVLAVAVQPRFALWNTLILSESLSVSLGVATVATWLWFVNGPSARRLTWAWGISAAWALTRDSNVVMVVVGTVPAALLAARFWRGIDGSVRRRLRVGSIAIVLVALYAAASQSVSDRNRYPTMNVIGQRVLVDEQLTDYYVGFGMPLDDALRRRTGRSSFDDASAFLVDPALSELRSWATSRGQWVHLSSMIRLAPKFVPAVWDDLPNQLRADHSAYDLFGVGDRLPRTLPFGLGGPVDMGQLAVWGVAAAMSLAAMFASRQRRPHGAVISVAAFVTAADVYVSWLGDSLEVQRHLMGAVGRLGVVLAMAVTIGVDELVRPAPGPNRAADDSPVDEADA